MGYFRGNILYLRKHIRIVFAKTLFQQAWFELGTLLVIHPLYESLKPPSEAMGIWSSLEVRIVVLHSAADSWD